MGQTDSTDLSLDSSPISLVDTSSLTAADAQLATSYSTVPASPSVTTGPSGQQITSQLIGTVGTATDLAIAAKSGSSLTAQGALVSPIASAASAAASTASSLSSSLMIAALLAVAVYAVGSSKKHPREAS
jgi:hypothetical protein